MRKIKLIREPGYVYDLLYVFSLYFNLNAHLSADLNSNKSDSDTDFYNGILKQFSPISDDIQVFFHLCNKNKRCFMTTYYFMNYKNVLTSDYNFEFLKRELSDHNRLIDNMFKFYFPELDEDKIAKIKGSIEEISKVIDKSTYDEVIKRKLYSFFINPERMIQNLVYELMSKEVLLAGYYEKNYKKILDIPNLLDFDNLKEDLRSFKDIGFIENSKGDVYLTTCLINRNCVNLIFVDDFMTLILGSEYRDSMHCYALSRQLPSLKEFGDVITEQNRIEILDLLLEHREITIKDLERLLDFTGSTAYYHLTMMMKQGMVKTRNQGRTIFYTLNSEYFESIVEILSKYWKEGV